MRATATRKPFLTTDRRRAGRPRWRCPGPALAVVALALASGAAPAQSPRSGGERPQLPDFAAPDLQPGAILPQLALPQATDLQGLAAGLRIHVRGYRFTGNTVLGDAELHAIARPFSDRELRFADLQLLRDTLTRAYIERGYLTSGAVLPPQVVRDGIVELRIVEGRLGDLTVHTDGHFRAEYFSARLRRSAEPVVQVQRIEERLQLLREDPRVARIAAQLTPGAERGVSNLDVVVEELSPYRGEVRVDNYTSPNVGAEGVRVAASHDNPSGRGDRLDGALRITEGLRETTASYLLPLNATGTAFTTHGRVNRSTVVDPDFEDLDIESESATAGVGLRQTLHETLGSRLDLVGIAEYRRSESFLLGESFNFSGDPDDPNDGLAKVFALRAGPEWTWRQRNHVLAGRAQLSVGVDVLDATIGRSDSADGRFVSLLAQVQWAYRPGWRGSRTILRADAQLADSPLLGMEQFAVGGHASVRGYRENQLVRDQGLVVSAEWRVALLQPRAGPSPADLVLFADAGRAHNRGRPTPSPQSISSVGLGLNGQIAGRWLYSAFWAHALDDVPPAGESNLQDDGVQFSITYRWPAAGGS